MKTPISSQLLFLLAAFLGAAGQWLYKAGADSGGKSITSYFSAPVIGGIICYTAVLVLFVAAFKRGGQPQVLYPIYACTFIFAAVFAWLLNGQPIRPVHVLGMALLIAGMFFMGR